MKGKGVGFHRMRLFPVGLILSTSSLNSLPRHWRKPPRKERKIPAGRGQPDTYTGVVWLERHARPCCRCRGHTGNRTEKDSYPQRAFLLSRRQIINKSSKKYMECVTW